MAAATGSISNRDWHPDPFSRFARMPNADRHTDRGQPAVTGDHLHLTGTDWMSQVFPKSAPPPIHNRPTAAN